MKAPKDHYIIQIEVTNACIHHCSNCTRLCGHHKKPFFMEYETFCQAVDSVLDHPGLIGVMGGEPTLHPRFADICQYLYKKLPKKKLQDPSAFTLPTDSFIDVRRRRELDEFEIHEYEDGPRPIIMGAGLWTTMTPVYMKNFELIQDVFRYQSLNDHSNASYHQPVLISRKDMGICDDQWIKLREKCWVNQQWSSSITPKGCFFCEVAAAMDMLYDGPGGLPIEKGWWKRDIEDFKEQFRWCELCGIPLKTFGRDAREGIVDVSAENAALLQEKKTARYIPERLNIVQIKDGVITEESKKAADAYHGISYINDAQERVSNTTPIYAGNFTGVLLCESEKDYEENTARIYKNLKYLEKMYVVINGVIKKILGLQCEEEAKKREKISLMELLKQEKEGTYLLFMTPEIELGDGFEKLKKCVVNPGTLHMIDFSQMQDGRENPYISNADILKDGVCALFNNNALSLRKIDESVEADVNGLRDLWENWNPQKRTVLSEAMNALMLGVNDPKRQRETARRHMREGIYLVKRWIKQYGFIKTGYFGVRMVNKYGVQLSISKLKSRIF